MIIKDRLNILDDVLKSAQEILQQYKDLAEVASEALNRTKVHLSQNATEPKEILDTFKRVHDMQMQSMQLFTNVLEKFPVEHTIQELQMLELFRNLTEHQKRQFMSQLEQFILNKRQR